MERGLQKKFETFSCSETCHDIRPPQVFIWGHKGVIVWRTFFDFCRAGTASGFLVPITGNCNVTADKKNTTIFQFKVSKYGSGACSHIQVSGLHTYTHTHRPKTTHLVQSFCLFFPRLPKEQTGGTFKKFYFFGHIGAFRVSFSEKCNDIRGCTWGHKGVLGCYNCFSFGEVGFLSLGLYQRKNCSVRMCRSRSYVFITSTKLLYFPYTEKHYCSYSSAWFSFIFIHLPSQPPKMTIIN